MHQLLLVPPKHPGPESLHLIGVLDSIDRVRILGTKVYQTFVQEPSDMPCYQQNLKFLTMSKDLHLYLGTMGRAGQYHLAKLLEEEFQENKCNQLLLRSPERSILVTQTIEHGVGATVFTLSPDH
jgi:hypothetical protein